MITDDILRISGTFARSVTKAASNVVSTLNKWPFKEEDKVLSLIQARVAAMCGYGSDSEDGQPRLMMSDPEGLKLIIERIDRKLAFLGVDDIKAYLKEHEHRYPDLHEEMQELNL